MSSKNLPYSEVFENYAKIADEKGLIDKSAKRIDRGHNSLSNIEALYGINPNKDQKEDIIDQAHPETVVIAPAHDRFNGVVENIKERQRIMAHIATKPTHGNLSHHRYVTAHNELLNNLVRIGFSMDNKDQDDLRKLADSCSEKLVKIAPAPLAAGAAGIGIGGAILAALTAGAAGLGIIALVNNLKPGDQGVLNNVDNALTQLQEIDLDDVPAVLGSAVGELIEGLTYFRGLAQSLEDQATMDVDVYNPAEEDLKRAAQDPNAAEKKKAVANYVTACNTLARALPRYIRVLEVGTAHYKKQNWPRGLAWLRDFGRHIWPETTKDAALALETLRASLPEAIKNMNVLYQTTKSKAEPLAKALGASQPDLPGPKLPGPDLHPKPSRGPDAAASPQVHPQLDDVEVSESGYVNWK